MASSYHSAHAHNNHHHQHLFQHQSSVTSASSVQTVLSQNLQNSTNVNKLIENVCQNGNHLNMNTFGSCSSLITTTGHVVAPSVANGHPLQQQQLQQHQQNRNSNPIDQQMNSSVSSAEEPLSVADVADLLHPQYAVITGEILLVCYMSLSGASLLVQRSLLQAPKCRQSHCWCATFCNCVVLHTFCMIHCVNHTLIENWCSKLNSCPARV